MWGCMYAANTFAFLLCLSDIIHIHTVAFNLHRRSRGVLTSGPDSNTAETPDSCGGDTEVSVEVCVVIADQSTPYKQPDAFLLPL